MTRKKDFFHTGLDVSRSECQAARRWNLPNPFGDEYYVDGTDGLDVGDGAKDYPFKTVQYAITYQIAHNSGKGDSIYVLPGTYAESLTGALTGVRLLGVGLTPNHVIIAPTDGGSYAGTLTDSIVSGFTFRSSSGTNTTYAAFRAENMYRSVFDSNILECGYDVDDACGFRIGLETEAATDLYWMQRSRITNNLFGTRWSGMNFWYGISFGPCVTSSTYAKFQVMQDSIIGWNDVAAEINGILANVRYTTGSNALIRNNNVHGGLLYSGQCHEHGIRGYDRGHDNKLIKVYWNNISAQSDCISGFVTQNVMGNIVGTGPGTGTPVDETMNN